MKQLEMSGYTFITGVGISIGLNIIIGLTSYLVDDFLSTIVAGLFQFTIGSLALGLLYSYWFEKK